MLWKTARIRKVHEHRKYAKSKTHRKLSKKDARLVKKRWVVEHFFADFKKFRRVQTRQERLLANYASSTFLVFIMLFFRSNNVKPSDYNSLYTVPQMLRRHQGLP